MVKKKKKGSLCEVGNTVSGGPEDIRQASITNLYVFGLYYAPEVRYGSGDISLLTRGQGSPKD